ncbi:heme-binding domain-containing protein [Chryseobacterium geocarposphaerae]|uniref:Heme-binding protein n=1 Tax=Chryseobacterium geocarposphaerae TaxID=1416776 RepID=A0A2M9C6W5_9FLAO|nr:heme-binding domain-containing protein [Chryseobacterium geocarposphaerae]PJJ66601.1 heme-binding protein [Chryseobacterium geocarposphaerae]
MKKSSLIIKSIAIIFLLLLVIQLFDTDKNISATPSENAIEKHYQVSSHVQGLLKTSCYDCHSNNTAYPWYSNIQPVKWWLADHVNSGKRHLNFDEFNTYTKERKLKKLDEVAETVKEGEMPLSSYTIIHHNAKLSSTDKSEIEKWVVQVKKEIRSSILFCYDKNIQ